MSTDTPGTTPASAAAASSKKKPTPQEVSETLAFVDGALGAAGHSVDDAATREILRRQAADEISGDEARALFRQQQGMD
jgi:hypothetical protein